MLSTIAFTVLVAWVVVVAGPFEVGQLAHVLLLVGLMLLLLAFLKARDAAAAARAGEVTTRSVASDTPRSKEKR